MNSNLISALRNMADDIGNIGASPFTVDLILIQQAIAALEPQWRPIEFNEEGDPTNVPADTPILVPPTKRLGMAVAKWNPLDGWETETCSEWVGMYRPTHWQPLPAEPEVV